MKVKEAIIQEALGLKVPEMSIVKRVDTGARMGATYVHRGGEWYWTPSIGGGNHGLEDSDPVDTDSRDFLSSFYLGRVTHSHFRKIVREKNGQ